MGYDAHTDSFINFVEKRRQFITNNQEYEAVKQIAKEYEGLQNLINFHNEHRRQQQEYKQKYTPTRHGSCFSLLITCRLRSAGPADVCSRDYGSNNGTSSSHRSNVHSSNNQSSSSSHGTTSGSSSYYAPTSGDRGYHNSYRWKGFRKSGFKPLETRLFRWR